MGGYPTPEGLRNSVAVYRDIETLSSERDFIIEWWSGLGIPNQFAALTRAAQIEKGE